MRTCGVTARCQKEVQGLRFEAGALERRGDALESIRLAVPFAYATRSTVSNANANATSGKRIITKRKSRCNAKWKMRLWCKHQTRRGHVFDTADVAPLLEPLTTTLVLSPLLQGRGAS